MTEPAFIFIDTNTLLHFQRPDQIDWPALVAAPSVTLIITPVVLRELDRQKVHNPKKRLRDRANDRIKWLSGFIQVHGDPSIRSHTSLRFIRHEPQLDLQAHRLSPQINDDILIAHAIEHHNKTSAAPFVVTADIGLTLKLPAHGITILELDDTLRLAEEKDEAEKELAKAQKELDAIKSRRPELKLTFPKDLETLALVISQVPEIEAKHENFDGRAAGASIQLYIARYAKYALEYAQWKDQWERSTAVKLVLANTGTAVATDISLLIVVPDFVRFLPIQQIMQRPKPPKAPSHHRTIEPIHTPALPDLVTARSPNLSSTEPRAATFSVDRLVHGRVANFDPAFLIFNGIEDIQDFMIGYRITLEEYPKPIEGYLDVKVRTGT